MPKIELPFATQEGKSSVPQNSRERLTNMFTEPEVSGRRQMMRRQRPALLAVLANTAEKRCIEENKGTHYCVLGNTLYSFDGASLTSLGTLDTSTGRCTMIFNDNDQIMVSDGVNGYYYNGSALAAVTSPVAVGHLTYIGGYGIFGVPGTGQFYITGLNDFSTVDALDFATAESAPDNIVRVFANHNELILFGDKTVETWQLSGGADFPFTPFTSAVMERGIRSPFSIVADDNTVFWLGDDDVVYRMDGYRPVRISTHPIERDIQATSLAARLDTEAFVYTVGGHKFYTISFGEELTVQFNIATNLWNLANSYGYDYWRIMGSAGRKSDYYLTPAGIVSLSAAINQDEGGILRRSAVGAPIWAQGALVVLHNYFLDIEVGRASAGVEPQIMLRVARDGEVFGNERWRSLGTTGDYRRRVMWRNLGKGRRMTLEVAFTDDANFAIVGGDGNVTVAST